jgi:hypothetical protein
MRKTWWNTPAILVGVLAFGLGVVTTAQAQEGHDHAGATHGGGDQRQAKRFHFETAFSKSGLKLAAHGPDHRAIDVSGLDATATFYHPSSENAWFTRKLRPAPAGQGQVSTSLELVMDLSRVPTKGARVVFRVSGLPDPGEPTVSFTVPFTLADDGSIAVGPATKADEKAIAAQRVCPVSSEELGEMGPPVKVTRGERSIFLCCKNCLKQVQADPEKFFSASATPKSDAAHHHAH